MSVKTVARAGNGKSASATKNVNACIQDLLLHVEQQAKQADEGGDTTHPVGKAESDTQPAQEGSQGTANDKIEAESYPQGVGSATANDTGSPESDAENVMNPGKTTGKAPEVEDDYKMKPSDPGTSHPADASKLAQLLKQSEELGRKLVAAIAAEVDEPKQAQLQPAGTGAPVVAAGTPAPASAAATVPAAEQKAAGAELADVAAAAAGDASPADKLAADAIVTEHIEFVVRDALRAAEKTAEYLRGFADSETAASKTANDDENGEAREGDESNDDNQSSASAAATGADEGAPSEQELMALLAGGDAMGAPGMSEMAGGDAGMGGSQMGEMGGAAGGGVDMAMIEAVCQELGITPEQLKAALMAKVAAAAKPIKKAAADDQRKAALRGLVKELLAK